MRLILISLAGAIALATPAFADDAPKPDEPRKICRTQPPKTGSNRPGKRICHTAAEWKVRDNVTLDYDRTTEGTPMRSQSSGSGS